MKNDKPAAGLAKEYSASLTGRRAGRQAGLAQESPALPTIHDYRKKKFTMEGFEPESGIKYR